MWRPKERIKYQPQPGPWPSREEAAASMLFSPVEIGPIALRQRTWVPAMVPWRATEDGIVTQDILDWYERYAMGNVQQGIDHDITKRIQTSDVDSRATCSQCWARHYCGGGCHHDNLTANGEISEPDAIQCEIFRHSMRRALEMTVIEGIDTTVPLHRRILDEPDFVEGRLSTAFMDRFEPA